MADCARVYAVVAKQAGAESEHHAERAIALLRQAVARGFRDFGTFIAESDYANLRLRDDFADFLWSCADSAAR